MIAPVGYGKGLPVLLPWGLAIMRRLVDRFAQSLDVERGARWEPELLVDADVYDRGVAAFGGFDNVFRLTLGDRCVVARPDAALEGIRRAMARTGPDDTGDALAVYQGHRRLQGATAALYRDSAIWPFVQLDRVVPTTRAGERIEAVLEGLVRFFTELALPVRIVRNGPWKAYARERYDVVLADAGAQPTVVAMLYVVGTAYREQTGLDDGYEALDVGVTEKVVAASWLTAPKSQRWTLPSSLAPDEVVVASDNPHALDILGPTSARTRLVPLSGARWWRGPWRRGTPVLIELRGNRARTLVGTSPWRALHFDDETLDDLVLASDAQLAARARTPMAEGSDPCFLPLCGACAASVALTAPVVPDTPGACDTCGRPGLDRLVSEHAQVY